MWNDRVVSFLGTSGREKSPASDFIASTAFDRFAKRVCAGGLRQALLPLLAK